MKLTLRYIFTSVILIFIFSTKSFAGVEPYENFIKGKLNKNDSLFVKDEKFKNPLFNWSEITNISCKNTISLRILDELVIDRDFSAELKLRVVYFSDPLQIQPLKIDSVKLKVTYFKNSLTPRKLIDITTFKNGYYVKIYIDGIKSPEFGENLPASLQLTSSIVIDRKYRFKPFLSLGFNGGVAESGELKSGSALSKISGGTSTNSNHQLKIDWPVIIGAEEYDIEWTTVDNDGQWKTLADSLLANIDVTDVRLNDLFKNNATRVTTHENSYLISLMYTSNFLLVRMRQVAYDPDGIRLEGNWDYRLNSPGYPVARWDLSWHQPNLNWQYASSYAEEGKKKEIVNYFDGSLRDRQTVTINNSDNVAIVQENIYDQFGRLAANILPAPVKINTGTTPEYLHYFQNFNRNASGNPYNFTNLNGAACEPFPAPLNAISGASNYYSPTNQFLSTRNKPYDKYIPNASGYPLSVVQYTADNTGRVKIQGGVGTTFQPGAVDSKTTKYFYGKPEQWELDTLFGNDVGYAKHYLKNMVVDPNGQVSVSYVNPSGKTIATALAGKSPSNVEKLTSIPTVKKKNFAILGPNQFIYQSSELKLTATTTYIAVVPDTAILTYNVENLISRYPVGVWQPCSNCYYELTITVSDDCQNKVYQNTGTIQLGSAISNCSFVQTIAQGIQVPMAKIGEYNITFELALSKKVIDDYTNAFIIAGQANGQLKKQANFIKEYLLNTRFEDCFSDCKTARQKLGSSASFTAIFNAKLDSLGENHAQYTTEIEAIYADLLAKVTALETNCINPSICDLSKLAMLEDVSPGGQYALFDADYNAQESSTNILYLFFKNGIFNNLAKTDPLYQANLVTLDDGTITSPYDANFTLAQLIKYWKPEWAEKFLIEHPEYCKLQFCNQNAVSNAWDERIEKIQDPNELYKVTPGLTYSNGNAIWLLNDDPFFKSNGLGSAYYAAMYTDLSNYSQSWLKVNTFSASTSNTSYNNASIKNINQMVDYLLYCADASGNTHTATLDTWTNCNVNAACRIPSREWELLREMYLEIKKKYIALARNSTTCQNVCEVGIPIQNTDLPTPQSCNSVLNLGVSGIQLTSNQFSEINYFTSTQLSYTFVNGTSTAQPDLNAYCSSGSVTATFYPCIKVYLYGSNTPIFFNNVWQITCSTTIGLTCTGNSGYLYASYNSDAQTFVVNNINTTETYTIYTGYNQNTPPYNYCGGQSTSTYYQCYTVYVGSDVYNFSDVWVASCITSTGGGGGNDPCGNLTYTMSRALAANTSVNEASTQFILPCEKSSQLMASTTSNELIVASYNDKSIYSVVSASAAKTKLNTNLTKSGFDVYQFKEYFAVQVSAKEYMVKKDVWVANYLPEEGSIKANQLDILKSMRTAKLESTVATSINNNVQTRFNTQNSCLQISDNLLISNSVNCGNNIYQDEIWRTTIALIDNSGNPVLATTPVTVSVKYDSNGFGGGYVPLTQSITIPIGQSYAYIDYPAVTYQYYSFFPCIPDLIAFGCVESISGANFCNGITDCNGVVINPVETCPSNLLTKTSRFDKVNYDVLPANGLTKSQMEADYNASLAQIVADNCQGSADVWMESLNPGLIAGGYDAATIALLRTKLIEICQKGGDMQHPMGASTLNTGVVMVGNTACYSFGDVIKSVLGISSFTNTLNPWLLETPYPYDPKQVATELVISNTSADICNRLTNLNVGGWSINDVITFHNYLISQFGTAMTLSIDELRMLMKSCDNCRFLLAKDIKLPVFLQANNQCKTKTDVQNAIVLMNAAFNSIPVASWSNYETIVSNYLNHKFGFSFTYDRYAQLLGSSDGTQLCNELPYTSFEEDPYACMKSLIEVAVGNGMRDYNTYIDAEREAFRTAYINTCAAAKASANLDVKQQIYHYTLYYYDLAGNLVRTVPPEGVSFLTSVEMAQVQKARDFDASNCNYNGPTVNAAKTTALQQLSNVLASNGNNAIEMWIYSNNTTGRQFIAATPDMKYMMQACINNNKVNIDIFSLNQTATSNVSFVLSNHVTADISNITPLPDWMHVVVQGTKLADGTLQIWVNGTQYSPIVGAPPAGCDWTVGGNPIVMPENLGTLKHLRLYERLMSNSEIMSNAANSCFGAVDVSAMSWYRFNVPSEPGSQTTIAFNSTNETQYNPVFPKHGLTTTYAYNSTNQVIVQQTPDAGSSSFWYDYLSRLVISQNAKQKLLNNYSYTKYDQLGRITEVGQRNTAYNIGSANFLSESTIASFNSAIGTNSQLTQTIYDEQPAVSGGVPAGLVLKNLRKRVSASIYRETPSTTTINASYYSYDITGNVKKLYQQVNGLGVKTLDYEYDLISGKVNFLAYQHGASDQFYYQYKYDAENRLTEAWSAVQASVNNAGFGSRLEDPYRRLDASYSYYLHGPLARVELGDVNGKVQGLDYAYTLQGWLKMLNGTTLTQTRDIGQDWASIAKDALAYSLGYYNNDYIPIGTGTTAKVHNYVANALDPSGRSLYNGNISNSTYAISGIASGGTKGYSYNYDQLNRIKNVWQHTISAGNWGYGNKIEDYSENFSYDGNGNILTLNRKKASAVGMDQLTYNYTYTNGKLQNNKLNAVSDALGINASTDQGNAAFGYDAIGNMISDSGAGITAIDWNVYGKIRQITKASGNISYTYDPAGNRVSKTASGLTTYYVLDAQGNNLAVYDNASNTINWREQQLYGSSRLGMWRPNINLATSNGAAQWNFAGLKFFELTNHLGNVNVVINDVRTLASTIYSPTVIRSNDYYAFGGLMAGRAFKATGSTPYRYGFNGKENDNEVKGEGNEQDYGMRIYEPRIGRFLSVDPLMKGFPWYTPYQFAGNSPIANIDLDGAEPNWFMINAANGMYGKTVQKITFGTTKGIETSLTNTYNFFRRDAWKLETWKQTGLLLEEVILSSSPHSGVYNPSTPKLDAMVKNFENDVINGDAYTRSKFVGQLGTDVLTAYVGSKGLGSMKSFAATTINTGYDIARQSLSLEAVVGAGRVKSGAKLYRIGTNGISKTGAEAQYWSLENPLLDPEGYAKKYNVPLDNIKNADFIETSTLKKNAKFVTREAGSAPGSANQGKGIEAVIEKGGTTNNVITPIKK